MKLRNFLSVFLCVVMVFAVGQSIAISSSAHEYNTPKTHDCYRITNNDSISLSQVQKTASSWKKFDILAVIIVAVLLITSIIVCTVVTCRPDDGSSSGQSTDGNSSIYYDIENEYDDTIFYNTDDKCDDTFITDFTVTPSPSAIQ